MGSFDYERKFSPEIGISRHLKSKRILLDYTLVAAACVFIAFFLTVLRYGGNFRVNLIYSESYGLSILSSTLLFYGLGRPKTALRWFALSAAGILIGTAIGSLAGIVIVHGRLPLELMAEKRGFILQALVICSTAGAILTYVFYSKTRIKVGDELIQEERIKRLASEKEILEAHLKLLQAQIEPHFLFNTLSNILSLIDTEPAKGKAMLMDLTQFLRTSLSRTRPERTTLDQESVILRAYLNIQKTRMGVRLRFHIDVPEALRQVSLPPMLIQPLVENAVKHGIEPKIEGGEITVRVSEQNGRIRIEVADTGCGWTSDEKGGMGLANIRERLKLLYDGKAELILEENTPQGVKATIEVPKNA
jgi:sensor histidine kinase YesM